MTILALGSLMAIGPLSNDMYLPAFPMIADELQTTASMTQLSLTGFLIGLALGQLIVGPLSDIHGRRKPLMLSLSIYILMSILCAVTPSAVGLILLRVVQGVAGGAGIVIARASARDLYSGPELTKFFAMLTLVNGAAPILAPIAGGLLLHITSWRGIFLVLGCLGAAMLIAAIVGLPESLPAERRRSGGITNTLQVFRGLLRDKFFMGCALTQGFVFAGMFAYISGSSFVLQNVYGVTPQTFSMLFAINGMGIIIASQTTGRLAGKVSEIKLLEIGLAMAIIGGIALFAAIVSGGGLLSVMIPLFFVVSSVGMVSASSFSLVMQNQGETAGSAAALLGLISHMFGAMVAPFVGMGGKDTAIPMGTVILLVELAAIVTYLVLVKRGFHREVVRAVK